MSSSTTFVSRVADLHASLKHSISSVTSAVAQQQDALRLLREAIAREQAALSSMSASLTALKGTKMTLSALQSTQVGMTVNKLRKSDDEPIAALSSELVKSWKRVAEGGGRGMEADGTVDRSGKSPTKASAGGGSSSGGIRDGESYEDKQAAAIARLQDRYAGIEEQKNKRKITQLSEKEAGLLASKRKRRL